MNKVVITGGNGFIGTRLIKKFSDEGYFVYALVKDEKENIDNIKNLKNVKIVYCDFNNYCSLHTLINDDIDLCVHLAWAGSFGNSRADYKLQLKNCQITLELIEELKIMNVKRFVCAGTLAEKDVLNYHLDDYSTPNDVSIYGIAKLNTHLMSKAICNKFGIEHIWCQLSNTYGVGNTTNNFVNMASRKMIKGERASFTSAEQYYDFVYIDDTIEAIFQASTKGKNNCNYYLGSSKPRKLKEYICIIRDTIDKNIPLYLGEVPFNGKSLSLSDYSIDKLVEDTGFIPKTSFEEGIVKTIGWLKENDK